MSDFYRFTILGCGSSAGVPRPNGFWGACNPNNPKNKRYRTSLLVQRIQQCDQKTTVIIDTGADFRSQMLDMHVENLNAAIYTHFHADHTHGIDDLRSYALAQKCLINIYADTFTLKHLNKSFEYCFQTSRGSNYSPILKAHPIEEESKFIIQGKGGAIIFSAHPQLHGSIHSLGFRIGNVAYCTDVNHFPEKALLNLMNLDVLIIDALQFKPHVSHFSVDQALHWINYLKPKKAILTHMDNSLDYDEVMKYVPSNVEPAYQGLTFETDVIES
ncbi:MBL fold metallo-hydrolase [Bartonella ancashensis]|uniref:Metal-dependent hydrolases of the beta-lactamase superfamily I n=1 Tax=Bartonella ancashensis TaxID=1318743 RepID=A0A0M4LGY3_9HYPH|nr:MBL fold metallo-hydrolase [Bartonella ancashensis]ALE03782.1 Metal-dependent hydrolases of the beta-lactamase superfamily I [Bartonella ancashensis]